jgi:hypothetical protein
MYRAFILAIFIYSGITALAQNNVRVKYNYDASGNAGFMAENYTAVPVYISLDFSYLRNASFSDPLPYVKRVEPGSTSLFTIYREPDMPAPDFNIEYSWFPSNPKPEIDPDFPYLIPAKEGTTVSIDGARPGWENRPVVFALKQTNEICASRKGIVVNVVDSVTKEMSAANPKLLNYLDILHDDGTIGEYINFAYRGVSCEIGQKVFPGQVLGKTFDSGGNGLIGFRLYHHQLSSKTVRFLIPEFYNESGKVEQLTINKSYRSVHPSEIIEKELSRKEKKSLKP